MSATIDPKRVAGIAETIFTAVASTFGDVDKATAAKGELTKANEKVTVRLEDILATVANVSSLEAWTKDEIKAAQDAARNKSNDATRKSTIRSYVSHIGNAAHPLARDHFTHLKSVVWEAWALETTVKDMAPSAETPVMKLHKRRYFALLNALRAAADGTVFASRDAFIAHAKDNDPDRDAEKIASRLDKIRDQLVAFYADFPVADIQACIDLLGIIGKDELAASRPATTPTQSAPSPAEKAALARALIANKKPDAKSEPAKPAKDKANKPAASTQRAKILNDVDAQAMMEKTDALLDDNMELAAD